MARLLTVLLEPRLRLAVLHDLLHALYERDPVCVRDGRRDGAVVLDRIQRVTRVERVVVRGQARYGRLAAAVQIAKKSSPR